MGSVVTVSGIMERKVGQCVARRDAFFLIPFGAVFGDERPRRDRIPTVPRDGGGNDL